MKIKDAVATGAKYFKVKTDFGIVYLELVDQFTTYNVKSLFSGNKLNVRDNYEVTPLKDKPTEKKMNQDHPYRSSVQKQAVKNINRVIPVKGASIPEYVGKSKGNKTEGPTMKDIIAKNMKDIKTKDDIEGVLKRNGLELSSSTKRYAWYLRNQILKGGN